MKNLTKLILLILFLIQSISCHHNRLKTNEKELANEILLQEKEKEKPGSAIPQKNSPGTGNQLSASFRKKEIRSVDNQRPPVKIDIMGTVNNIRKFKLSDVASSIRYIKLQTPPDTALLYDNFFYRNELMSTIRSDGDQIIFQGIFGLVRFNMLGEYQETIWKNKTGIRFQGKVLAMFGGRDFFGVLPNIPVSLLNRNLYYNFQDGPGEKGQVLKYKLRSDKNFSVQPKTEVSGLGTVLGDTLFNTPKTWGDGFNGIFGTSPDTWAGVNDKWKAGKTGSLLVSYNNKGDTLCHFIDYERFINFSFGEGRIAVELMSYYYNGLLTIKQEYNDTVFRLIPPERLLPVYILDFGKYKFNFMDGFNPNFDLSDKFMLNSIYETNSLLFIRYTQNYDCPSEQAEANCKIL